MTSMGNIVLSFSMMYFQVVVLMTFSSAQPSVNIQTNEADVSHKTLTNFLTSKRRVMLDVEQETFSNDKNIELESDLLSRQFRDVVSETNISLSSHANNTDLDSGQDHEKKYQPDPIMSKGMLKRTFYILVGVMAIIIVYFMVRAIRYDIVLYYYLFDIICIH